MSSYATALQKKDLTQQDEAVDTAFRAQVTISMAVMSYREGRVLYWDDKTMKVVAKAPKA